MQADSVFYIWNSSTAPRPKTARPTDTLCGHWSHTKDNWEEQTAIVFSCLGRAIFSRVFYLHKELNERPFSDDKRKT